MLRGHVRRFGMKTVRVVAAMIMKDGKVLATQRNYGDFAGGWEFPGGKIEQGETPEQALKSIRKFGDDGIERFEKWCKMFL